MIEAARYFFAVCIWSGFCSVGYSMPGFAEHPGALLAMWLVGFVGLHFN